MTARPGTGHVRFSLDSIPSNQQPQRSQGGASKNVLECAALLQATAVIAHSVWNGDDNHGDAWDHPATRVYCANDHEVEGWMPRLDVAVG